MPDYSADLKRVTLLQQLVCDIEGSGANPAGVLPEAEKQQVLQVLYRWRVALEAEVARSSQ